MRRAWRRLEGIPAGGGQSTSTRGFYFIAGDEQPTFAELGRLIAEGLGRQRVRIVRTSSRTSLLAAAALAEVAARVRGTPYIFNFDKAREALAGNWTCSSQAIRRELGFAPRAPFVDRLRQTSNWYLEHNLI